MNNISSISPRSADGRDTLRGGASGGGGQCLCSPTTHPGSFRCRFHRSSSKSDWAMKRSNSMPISRPNTGKITTTTCNNNSNCSSISSDHHHYHHAAPSPSPLSPLSPN